MAYPEGGCHCETHYGGIGFVLDDEDGTTDEEAADMLRQAAAACLLAADKLTTKVWTPEEILRQEG